MITGLALNHINHYATTTKVIQVQCYVEEVTDKDARHLTIKVFNGKKVVSYPAKTEKIITPKVTDLNLNPPTNVKKPKAVKKQYRLLTQCIEVNSK